MAKEAKNAETESVSEDSKPAERVFPVATLRGNCVRLFGCTSSTFDGAFYGYDISKKITIADADKKIRYWLGKEIK